MRFTASDGVGLAYASLGEGRPVILVHGFLSSGQVNWIGPGTAERLAGAGRQVIVPDLRAHGLSQTPGEAGAYPKDVLVGDLMALIAHLAVSAYDLVGYSLGARTVLGAVVRAGARPGKLVLGGMGLTGVLDSGPRCTWFVDTIRRRDEPDQPLDRRTVTRFLKSTGTDPDAAIRILQSQVNATPAQLAALEMPTLVIAGAKDSDNGSASDLAAAVPGALYAEVPGTHMSAVLEPAFAAAITDFLAGKGTSTS